MTIEDVAIDGQERAGLRVLYQSVEQVRAVTKARSKFDTLRDSILTLIADSPNLTSRNAICARVTGGSKPEKLEAIRELLAERQIEQPAGDRTPFRAVSDRFGRSKDETGTGLGPAPSGGGPQDRVSEDQRTQERRELAERDAAALDKLSKNERRDWARACGWGDARLRRALSVLSQATRNLDQRSNANGIPVRADEVRSNP